MFEILHFSINSFSETCTVVFNVPKIHKKTFDKFELVHFSFKSTASSTCSEYEYIVINGYRSTKLWCANI